MSDVETWRLREGKDLPVASWGVTDSKDQGPLPLGWKGRRPPDLASFFKFPFPMQGVPPVPSQTPQGPESQPGVGVLVQIL